MKYLLRKTSLIISLILLTFFSTTVNAQTSSEHYHLLSNVILGGEGGWDFLTFDDAQHRLFISHSTHVIVYDVVNGEITGDIAKTEGVHGIGIANDVGRGFISNGKSNTVLMFDLKNLDTLKRITVGQKPDAIIYDPYSKMVIVCNAESNNITILEASSGLVKATIPLSGNPEFSVSDLKGHVFINIEDKSEVVEIDMNKLKVVNSWSLEEGEGPTGIAMDITNHRLFIGCANKVMVVLNSDNGKVITKLPIGKGVDAVVFDAEKKMVISSNGEGNLTIIKEKTPDKFEVAETIKTLPGARTEALDSKTHDLYLITADFGPAPEATKEHPHPRPTILPNTFKLLKYGY